MEVLEDPSRNPAESDPVWGTGTALAGGTAQGSTFPRDMTRAICVSRAQFCSPLPQPRANPLCQSLGATPPGGGNTSKSGGVHIWRLKPLLCPRPQLAAFSFFSFLILKTNILLTPPPKPSLFALVIPINQQPPHFGRQSLPEAIISSFCLLREAPSRHGLETRRAPHLGPLRANATSRPAVPGTG